MPIGPHDLNLRHLRAIHAVAEAGSVSAAAGRVSLSQPAITQAVAKIERQVGARLFERSPVGMAATDAGRLLSDRTARAMAHLARGGRALSRSGSGRGFAALDRLVTMAQIKALTALAAHGSYSQAARASGLSQPALHRAVGDIERLSGLAMAVRQGRGVRLTDGARVLARAARLAIGEIEAGLGEIAALQGRGVGRIAIGCMPLARARLLPAALAALHREQPSIGVAIVEGRYAELLSSLRDGDLDLLIGALRDPPPDDVAQRPLFEDRLVIVARAGHPLAPFPLDGGRVGDRGDGSVVLEGAGQGSPILPEGPGAAVTPIPGPFPVEGEGGRVMDVERLAAYPWVLAPEGTPLRAHWRALFSDRTGGPPAIAVDCGSVVAIRGLLIEGDWLTLLSPDQVRHEVAAGLLTVLGAPLERTRRVIGLTTRADWLPTAPQQRLVALLQAGAAQTLPKNQ